MFLFPIRATSPSVPTSSNQEVATNASEGRVTQTMRSCRSLEPDPTAAAEPTTKRIRVDGDTPAMPAVVPESSRQSFDEDRQFIVDAWRDYERHPVLIDPARAADVMGRIAHAFDGIKAKQLPADWLWKTGERSRFHIFKSAVERSQRATVSASPGKAGAAISSAFLNRNAKAAAPVEAQSRHVVKLGQCHVRSQQGRITSMSDKYDAERSAEAAHMESGGARHWLDGNEAMQYLLSNYGTQLREDSQVNLVVPGLSDKLLKMDEDAWKTRGGASNPNFANTAFGGEKKNLHEMALDGSVNGNDVVSLRADDVIQALKEGNGRLRVDVPVKEGQSISVDIEFDDSTATNVEKGLADTADVCLRATFRQARLEVTGASG